MESLNIDAKIHSKLLINQAQQDIKRIMGHNSVRHFYNAKSLTCEYLSIYFPISTVKKKQDVIIFIKEENAFNKIQLLFMKKDLNKLGLEALNSKRVYMKNLLLTSFLTVKCC